GTRTWTLDSGTLPLGVTLSSSGSFSGQPRANGNFPITVRVTDSSGFDTKNFTLVSMAIDQQPFSISGGATVNLAGTGRVAQTLTVGATGNLTGVRFTTL